MDDITVLCAYVVPTQAPAGGSNGSSANGKAAVAAAAAPVPPGAAKL